MVFTFKTGRLAKGQPLSNLNVLVGHSAWIENRTWDMQSEHPDHLSVATAVLICVHVPISREQCAFRPCTSLETHQGICLLSYPISIVKKQTNTTVWSKDDYFSFFFMHTFTEIVNGPNLFFLIIVECLVCEESHSSATLKNSIEFSFSAFLRLNILFIQSGLID